MSTPDDDASAPEIDSGMWKGSSSTFALSDVLDVSRTDLIERFEANPLGRHDLEVQLMVSSVRGNPRIPRYTLVRVEGGGWRVVSIAPERGGEPTVVSPRIFRAQDEAERFVFNLRVQDLARLGLTTGHAS